MTTLLKPSIPAARILARTAVFCAVAAALAACGGGDDSADIAPPPVETGPVAEVLASNAPDAAIDSSFGDNYVYTDTSVASNGKLFVFFPATGASPSNYTRIEAAAAAAGYRSLGLSYPNAIPVELLCLDSDTCPGLVREEILTGDDVSAVISVDRSNSIESRLQKTLQYLAAQHPSDGWGQFIDASGNVIWSAIRVGGHSQGGGMAGYLGTKHAVDRVCMLSAPADFAGTQPADWLFAASATDPTRFYGFGHLRDDVVPYANLLQNWAALNLTGTPTSVDTTASPYGGSHILTTDLDLPAGNADATFHGMTATDISTPLDASGLPVYRSVWQTACFS